MGSTGRLAVFEAWSPSSFVAAGLLLVVSFRVVAVLTLPEYISFVYLVSGIPLVVGLAGLYAQVDAAAPRRVLAGGCVVSMVAILAFAVTSGIILAGTPRATLLSAGMGVYLVGTAYLSLGVGLLLAGVGWVWSGVSPRSVGPLLVGAGFSLPTAAVVNNLLWELPGWFLGATHRALAVALVGTGVLLGAQRVLGDPWVPPHPDGADEATASGWTNEHVRDGHDVDGSESRTSPFRMATRLQLFRTLYALGGEGERARSLDALRRAVGRVVNRDAATEQSIAELEYINTTVGAAEREGSGSPYWWLGVALLTGILLAGHATGMVIGTVIVALVVGTTPLLFLFAAFAVVSGVGAFVVLASVRRLFQQLADQA